MGERPRPKPVGWAETRRLIRADVDVYALWYPVLSPDQPLWKRLVYVLFRTETFAAALRYRFQILLCSVGFRPLATALAWFNQAFSNVSIGHDVRIGGGLHLVHGFIVINGRTTLGSNATIAPFVTLGLSNSSRVVFGSAGPTLGDEVFLGSGARLLGPIQVGDRVQIGANAVVLDDVPDDHSAVGAPARSFPRKGAA
ncbi:MAG: serine acetyltransferase [bacterium]|nr:serine acetyltransferase [bacterium]